MTMPFEIEEQPEAEEVDLALLASTRSQEPPLVCFPLRCEWPAPPEEQAHPAPEVRGHWGNEAPALPASVLGLAELAREASWEVRTQYALGTGQHSRTGKPTSRRESIAVSFGLHPLSDCQAVAVYVRSGKGSWGWESIWIWGPSRPHFRAHLLADLLEWLEVGGQVDAMWWPQVEALAMHREREAKLRAKERAASGAGGAKRESGG